jgi:hypothetical protein
VVTRLAGQTTVTIHGPETRPREVYCPPEGEWLAIRFKSGTFMPALPVHRLINGNDGALLWGGLVSREPRLKAIVWPD